jgi:uncharacterized protein (TIGR00369 family)
VSFAALAALLRAAPAEGAFDVIPYAKMLGLRYRSDADGIVVTMPFAKPLVGAPQRLHGGTVAGLLEIASIAQVIHALASDEAAPVVKPINVTVDYLRAAACEDTFAAAIVTRMGRRIANVRAEAWQGDRAAPVAAAHMNVMLVRD